MSEYKTTHLAPSEIDRLRLQAFVTNSQDDMNAYYRAASLYFQERDVRAMNRANRIEELKAKLAKAVEALEGWINVYTHCTIEEGVCCCGDDMKNHTLAMDSHHMPLDHGAYIAGRLAAHTEATLAELKGQDDE
jgi:hypothetical protein